MSESTESRLSPDSVDSVDSVGLGCFREITTLSEPKIGSLTVQGSLTVLIVCQRLPILGSESVVIHDRASATATGGGQGEKKRAC